MAITVRVRNFQSVEDATIIIDGFTVITGSNNAGKSAMIRAIRGVFTNAPPGPLVRHGCTHLTVDIKFEDGNTITWEKGAKINRYIVNGKTLDTVGRGVPPEVEALGIRSIQAGTDRIWPQIADQFSGSLFLVGSPGSAIAEAVADVDRVGKLSSALKLSESDRRGVSNTLKVRRSDREALETELKSFNGLDAVAKDVLHLEAQLTAVEKHQRELQAVLDIQRQYRETCKQIDFLSGVREAQIPETEQIQEVTNIQQQLREMGILSTKLHGYQNQVEHFSKVSMVPRIQDGTEAIQVQRDLQGAKVFQKQMAVYKQTIKSLDTVASISIPDVPAKAKALQEALITVRNFRKMKEDAIAEIQKIEGSTKDISTKLTLAVAEVEALLTELGVCPTCRQPILKTN